MRYFLYFSYLGKNYHGWQVQPNALTVQEVLQGALSTILGTQTEVVGAGRTDTGVNARQMVAHFDCEEPFDAENIVHRLNSLLPKDIAVQEIKRVRDDAHARFSALSRTYCYYLYFQKTPFLQDLAYRHFRRLDFDKMNEAAQIMLTEQDFTSLAKLHTDNLTNLCTVTHAMWEPVGQSGSELWRFTITANRFLRDMVRATVGTLLWVGEGKISVEEFRQILHAKERGRAGHSVPAEGLYLEAVEYPEEVFLFC